MDVSKDSAGQSPSDQIASWHLLQLAEQGRGWWPASQYIASGMMSSGATEIPEALDELKEIIEQIVYLYKHPMNIWPGLMPGELPMDGSETHKRLDKAFAEVFNTTTETIEVTFIMSLEVGGFLACNQQGGLGHIKHEFYTNLSNQDQLNSGDILRVELDNWELIDGSEVHLLLN